MLQVFFKNVQIRTQTFQKVLCLSKYQKLMFAFFTTDLMLLLAMLRRRM